MAVDCPFCRIISKEIAAEIVYEDEEIVSFKDVNPMAPVHLLIVPRRHISSLADLKAEDTMLMGRLLSVANDLARAFNLDKTGYRVVINCGQEGGQLVYHLHLHLLGGKALSPSIA
ncbi:MAG: histidine triad nucleotide-binding protein [Dethiobacteria bacterium]|jgi:histidine triad (HIT) family protein|nr:histidine triad nucleotide-binding protein [Bacillota bacterium]NMD32384.1 histidine triad nucleotide-binding protein [Bacillota bacterium]HOB29238.1 histidine triad nucleotide-binding protein [Bacillota bacterium]HPZ41850.1 histidine triad nucleotide-binding protein [Bacillota bacterium]HQD52710.1 histidine triad nucleotide-binding protein [Bacillota bacterium]